MNSDDRSSTHLSDDDELRLQAAAGTLREHTDDRWVEIAGDVLSRVMTKTRPSHPVRARSELGDYQVSEQVLMMSLQRALDRVPHCEVTDIFVKTAGNRYTGVIIVVTAQYPYPIIPMADQIRSLAEARLHEILGAQSPDVTVSAMHVHVSDVSKEDPKLG